LAAKPRCALSGLFASLRQPNTILVSFQAVPPTIGGACWSGRDTGFVFGGWCRSALPATGRFGLKGAMAKLYFNYATMNAGKTTILLQASYNYRESGMTTMLFVAGHYRKDDRGLISSRIGLEAEAEMFRDGDDLYARIADHHQHTTVHCVFVDEAQFLQEEQVWQLARVADRLGIPVMCYGLRTDFQGKLFSGSRALLAIADDLREVRTICRCGRKATMVVRLGPDGKVARQGEQVAIGKDIYVSLCRRHWEDEMGRFESDDFIGFVRPRI
jgi:thymidine kinase